MNNFHSSIIGAGLMVISMFIAAAAPDELTRQRYIEAVEAAAAVDFYHAHCRGDVSARRMDNLNKLLVSSRRMTILEVKDDYFPERNYRHVEQRLERDFMALLRENGGCAGAKAAGLIEQFTARYEAALAAIRALP